jgi:endonuclease-3
MDPWIQIVFPLGTAIRKRAAAPKAKRQATNEIGGKTSTADLMTTKVAPYRTAAASRAKRARPSLVVNTGREDRRRAARAVFADVSDRVARWCQYDALMPGQRADGSIPSAAARGKARAVLNRLLARYPSIGTALDYDSAFRLLVVTVLSAQTTDENVNKVAPALFERYPTPGDLAEATPEDVEEVIFSTGFFRQKTKSIITLAQGVEELFDGEIPADIDELVKLPGVGRKTASVVLAEVWDIPAIAVDTHVKRVTARLGLTKETDPVKIEQDLKALYPEKTWSGLSMRIIQFGRDICDARRPRCGECELFRSCEWPDRWTVAGRERG